MTRGRSVAESQREFPLWELLFEQRWSHDFVNRGRGESRVALLKTRARSYECFNCSRQTSLTHRSKLPQTAWSWAAHLVTTHVSNYSHDPRVVRAVVGHGVLSFDAKAKAQAESTARRAHQCGARGRTDLQSRRSRALNRSKMEKSSRRRSSSTAGEDDT